MSIEGYKFYDDDLSHCHNSGGEVYLAVNYDCYDNNLQTTVVLNKDDVIALAKHFKLTTNDVEG